MTDSHPTAPRADTPSQGTERRTRFQAGTQAPHAREAAPSRRSSAGNRTGGRRKACQFCQDNIEAVDYKDVQRLRRYLAERAKIEPRRKYGTCARHQRQLTQAIKRARHVALLPFVSGNARG